MAPNGKTNGQAYPIEDHTYDVVVVGAGGGDEQQKSEREPMAHESS